MWLTSNEQTGIKIRTIMIGFDICLQSELDGAMYNVKLTISS